jgi:hypothetical protein
MPDLRQQELMLKQIEEKALQLKRKEKKERQILKQLRKGNEPRGSEQELIPREPAKPTQTHRRVISGLSDSGEEELAAKLSGLRNSSESQEREERLAADRLKCIELQAELIKLQQ